MKTRRFALFLVIVTAAAVIGFGVTFGIPRASGQSGPGVPLAETVEAINQSRVATRILYITAHPDDEDGGLLAYLSHGLDAEVGLLTITRGQGGQNAVGTEQDGPLGVIRTTELLAAGRYYGVHQFFTRAVDTGFSKSPEWTMKIWGDELPMEDMVRVIRTYRPQVVINGWGGTHNGHGQHQSSGLLTPQAVTAAADPTKFPDQIREGLLAWKVPLELRPVNSGFGPGGAGGRGAAGAGGRGGAGAAGRGTGPTPNGEGAPSAGAAGSAGRGQGAQPTPGVPMPTGDISPLWGVSYVEMGAEGRSNHVSQGTPTIFGAGFGRRQSSLAVEKGDAAAGLFDPMSLHESISSIAARFPSLQSMMAPPLASADQALASAASQTLALDRTAAAHSLTAAGKQIAALRDQISNQSGEDKDQALYEVDQVRDKIDRALADVVSLSIAVNADRHELVAGENFFVDVNFPDKPAVAVKYAVDSSSLRVPSGWTASLAAAKQPNANPNPNPNAPYRFDISIPAGALSPPISPAEAILPFPPPLVSVDVPISLDGYTFTVRRAIEYYETKTTGIETYPLELVPAVTLTVEPPEIMVPAKHAAAPVKLLARVRYHGTQPAKVSVGLDAPKGWNVQSIAPLDFTASGDQLVRYVITPPATLGPGAYPLHPYAKLGDETFRTSLEAIPTLPTRDWSEPNDATVHVLNLNMPAGLHIGYVAADNDPLPEVLRQLGIQVDMLDEVALSFNDLSHYDAIVAGIRAYELRPDLPRTNPRLLDYVKNGGSLVVQYEREAVWSKYKLAPYPSTMDGAKSNGLARTTDPNSPVEFLAPQNPLLNSPNKITLDDFKGWTQERGTYYWDTWDSHYVPILGLQDPGEPVVKGALMYARYGKGVYIYAGPVFFRELPAGVPGAYRLFVNLLSQTVRSAAKHD
jgi:LmbE family N-acetylglucosaminyl deacetylase